jgi:hypothetical protein
MDATEVLMNAPDNKATLATASSGRWDARMEDSIVEAIQDGRSPCFMLRWANKLRTVISVAWETK